MKPFPWRPRMAARVHLGGVVSIITARDGMALCSWAEGPAGAEQPRSAWFRYDLLSPVEDDGATKGAFLDAIREAWRLPTAHVVWSADKARVHDPNRPWRINDDNDPALIKLLNQYTWMVKGPGQTDTWLEDIETRVSSEVYGRVLRDILGNGPSEFAALMAAWEAAP